MCLSTGRELTVILLPLRRPECPHNFGRTSMTLRNPPLLRDGTRWPAAHHPWKTRLTFPPSSSRGSLTVLDDFSIYTESSPNNAVWVYLASSSQTAPFSTSPWPLATGPGSSHPLPAFYLRKHNPRLGPLTCSATPLWLLSTARAAKTLNQSLVLLMLPYLLPWMTPKPPRPSTRNSPSEGWKIPHLTNDCLLNGSKGLQL